MRLLAVFFAVLVIGSQAFGAVLVDIPLNQQINIGQGNAISGYSSFVTEGSTTFCRKLLTVGSGAGGWYSGPTIDLVKAGYGPYVDMNRTGATIEYTARYYQGGGNTNPYGDAPIFVKLVDVYGRQGGLGISYGARPDPTYPAWITCVDDMTTGDYPTDAGFDLSKVTKIGFFGTDWSGTGDDYVDIRDLKVYYHNPISIASAKGKPDGESVEIGGTVSAVFNSLGFFYLEDPTRACGIQVRSSTLPTTGAVVYATGAVRTDSVTGEMYLDADSWQSNGTAALEPVCVTNRTLGGGAFNRQQGVTGGSGLSNIGLLVKLSGKVTGVAGDLSYVYLSDGSGVSDGGSYEGVKVDLTAIPSSLMPAIAVGDKLSLIGISTVYEGADGGKYRMVRVRGRADYTNHGLIPQTPKVLKAIVINFDPFCPSYGNRRTHEVMGWNDPHALIEGYISDLKSSSGGWCRYQIVSWFDADYHAIFEDGFQYGADEYISAWNNRDTVPMHSGTADYIRICTDKSYPHNQPESIAERVASGEVDEVFMFGAPSGSSTWEAAMAGPSPFFVNGGTYYVPSAGRNFVLMGFNYERGIGEMLEDFCHRTECVMSRVYHPADWWFPTWPITNNWDRFRMFDQIHAGAAACGICHYAPNSTSDYDWGNQAYVYSTCDDWLYNWPNLKGSVTKRLVNCSEWGNGDIRLHHIWWLTHLPKAAGINPDGKQNNWWKYTCDFNSYAESR